MPKPAKPFPKTKPGTKPAIPFPAAPKAKKPPLKKK